MQVDNRKIQIKGFERPESLEDGSVRYVLYKKEETAKELLEFKKNTWNNSYDLKVNLPSERKLEKVIIITRTSANCYRVIISTTNSTELINCKTYDEINQCISKSLPK